MINGGKPNFEDIVEYRFGKKIAEYDTLSPLLEESPSPVNEQDSNELPDYIPSYFPPFPEVKQDEILEEVSFQAQQKILQQKKEEEIQQQQQQQQQQQLPVLVKNRKKPIENPFTHIIPFEDSSLTADSEDGQQQPLSLLVDVNNKRRPESEEAEQEKIDKRRKIATSSLIDALSKIKTPNYRLGEGLIGNNDELFRNQTQNAAAPGNYLFNHDIGVFDQVIRSIADPMVISKLTCPNLQTDIAIINTPNLPINQNPFQEVRSSPGPSSPERSSMLAALAGGGSSSLKKSGLKKSSQSLSHMPANPMSLSSLSNQTISKHSVDINAIKTGDSKYIIKKKRMLLEKQQLLERQQQQQQQQDKGPATIPTSQPAASNGISNGTSSTAKTISNIPSANTNTNSTVKVATSFSSFSNTTTNATNATPTSTFTSAYAPSASASITPVISEDVASPNTPKIRFKIKPPEPSASLPPPPPPPQKSTISLQQYQQQKKSLDNPIVRIKLEKNPLSSSPTTPRTVPTPPVATATAAVSRPTPTVSAPQRQPSSFSNSNGYSAEEIRCICENPTVDYGTFMIACDNCSVWFHGSCVSIAESDQVEEWYCKRCRR